MKRFLFSFCICICVVSQYYAQSFSYPIDASHSVISFSVGFAGGITTIDGRFNDFSGAIGYSNNRDKTSLFANATIDVKSINTGDKDRDEDLKGAGFFNVAEYPTITFKSEEIIQSDSGYMLLGTFSMMGKTSEIEIPISFKHDPSVVWVFGEPRIAIEGSFTINRIEYGIPKKGFDNIVKSLGSMTLSKKVEIAFVIQGVGQSLSDLIQERISEQNVTAGIALYNELEENEANKNTYTFGERTLVGIVMNLSGEGKNIDAIAFAEFSTAKNKESFMSWYGLAYANQSAGNKEKAIEYYVKALEINPKFSRAKSALDKLRE